MYSYVPCLAGMCAQCHARLCVHMLLNMVHFFTLTYSINMCPSRLCPQLYTDPGERPESAQQRGAHHGSGCGGVQGRLWRGPSHQPERSILPGSVLHEPHLYTHAHEPAQSV